MFGNKEDKEIAAEKRQMNFAREQNSINTFSDSKDELSYVDIQEKRSDLLKWQQDLDDEIVKLIMTLQGYSNLDGNGWIQIKDPMCNKKFIHDVVLPQTEPFLSRNMFNTNFTEEQILNDLRNTCDDIADAMADNYDSYEINFKDYDLISRLIKNSIKSGIFRALNGWNKKIDSTVFKSIEANTTANEVKPNKKLGFFR